MRLGLIKHLPLLAISVAILLSVAPLAGTAYGAEVFRDVITLNGADIAISEASGFDVITIPGGRNLGSPGEPGVPSIAVQYLIPSDQRFKSLRIIEARWVALGSGFMPLPVQKGVRSGEKPVFQPPSADAYMSGSWYPGEVVVYAGGGYLRGRRVEGFRIAPVRYRAQGGELEYLSSLEIEVELEGVATGAVKVSRAIKGVESEIDAMLGGLIGRRMGASHGAWLESEGVRLEEDDADIEGGFIPSLLPDVDGSAVEYVIVTNEEMAGEFERLAEWKTSKGVRAVVKTVEWIESNYPNGVDLAETIRFFLQDAYANWGTLWVLLAGDTDVVPIRYAWNRYHGLGGAEVPTDIYYSCLDGDWNGDGDDKWGEGQSSTDSGDLADIYPEVMVGRAPVNDVAQASVFIDKVIQYERDPQVGYQNKALFFAEVLFPSNWDGVNDPFMDGASLAETAAEALPENFEIKKLYENYTDEDYEGAGPLSPAAVIAAINEGYGIVAHVGHGYRTTMSVGSGTLHNPDIAALTNGPRVSVVTALNCDAAAVDYSCIAEAFILNPQGGGVAYLGSTRSEFPSASWPYQDEFYKLIFRHGITRMGQALAWSRLLFAPSSIEDTNDRWSQFVHILLGDPELTVWTGMPSALDVSTQASVEVGAGALDITVLSQVDGSPVEGATVTCRKSGEVYAISRTDASGLATLSISPYTPGTMAVTVTGRDRVPYRTEIPVTAAPGAHVYVESVSLDDSGGGDGDGEPERGEVIDIVMTVVNGGASGASEVTGVLTIADTSLFEVLVDSVFMSGLGAGASAQAPPFRLRALPSVPDGHLLSGRAVFSTSGGHSDYDVTLEIGAPSLEIYSTTIDDVSGGDGDGRAEPGETVTVQLVPANYGGGSADGVSALLTEIRGDASVLADSVYFGHMEGGPALAGNAFTVELGTHPAPSFELTIRDTLGVVERRGFDLVPPLAPVNVTGFGDVGSIRLAWSPAIESDHMGYVVYRSGQEGGPYTRVTPRALKTSSLYEDRGLDPLTRYFYTVTAQDSSGNESAFSSEISVSTNPPPLSGWPLSVDIETPAAVTLGDLDGDGDLEVVGAGGEIYAFHHDGEEVIDGDGVLITHGVFSSILDVPSKGFWCTPAVADIDGDGVAEIVANYWDEAETYMWNGSDGAIEPGWPRPSSQSIWSSPVMGDIDGDAQWDVVTGAQGQILAWHLDGTEVADGDSIPSTDGVLFDHGSLYSYGSTALIDLDGDGAYEVVAGLRDGRVVAVKGDGSEYPGFPYSTGRSVVSTPCGADVDGDGDVEIVVAVGSVTRPEDSGLHVVEVKPTVTRRWKTDLVLNRDFNSSPAVGDIDGDGVMDIVLGSGDGWVHALRGTDGSYLAGWPVEIGGTIQGSACIADVDGDEYPDVLIGGEDGLLHGLDRSGLLLPGFPIRLSGPIRGAPVVWDVDGDGLVNILCQAMDRKVYAWSYEGTFDPSKVRTPWPMFLHDPRNTSLFTTEMSFPVRIASWDLRLEGEGVVMTWSPVGWDGTGRWAVLRSGGEASAGAPSEGGGSGGSGVTGDGTVGGSVASGLDAQASGPTDNLRDGEPAFLAGYSEVTHLGILSVDGTSQLTFRDPAPGSGRVSYVLELLKEDGSRRLFGPRSVQSEGGASSLVPRLLSFGPNPFRSLAEFTLFLPDGARATAGHVTLRVFDAAGRTVSTKSWMNLGPGVHTLEWDGTGVSGSRLTTGVYFFSLEAGGIKSIGKLVLVR